jgi:hypothetical protein
MEHLRYIDLNFQDGIITSIFPETEESPYIINYIYDYNNLYNTTRSDLLRPTWPGVSRLATWSSISHDEIVLPAFIEQEFVIPDDAVCGITFEKPDCCTPCGHHFCRAAITRWLKQQKEDHKKITCPACRAEFTVVIPDNAKREFNLEDVD